MAAQGWAGLSPLKLIHMGDMKLDAQRLVVPKLSS